MQQIEPNHAEVEQTLERILRLPEFLASPRQQSFLRFVVSETLAGRANRLKAFTIATSVFGRNESFDPQTNSIVRVEALRLRRLLDQYYAGAGAHDPLQIRIRRGAYVPEFVAGPPVQNGDQPVPAAEEVAPPAAVATMPLPAIAPRRHNWAWAGAAVLVFFIAMGAIKFLAGPAAVSLVTSASLAPSGSTRHTSISVGPIEIVPTDGALAGLPNILSRQIEDALERFDNPVVIHDATGKATSDYRLTGLATPTPHDEVALSFRMLHVASGEIVWSKQFPPIPSSDYRASDAPRIDAVATALAQSYGAIHADMRRRLGQSAQAVSGYGCVILAYEVFDAPSQQRYRDARTCLENAIAADPGFASGNAALSYLEIASWADGVAPRWGDQAPEQALALARRAVRLAPDKGRMHTAQFWARFFNHRYDEAFEAAQLAMELNPYAGDTLARVGAAHMLRGDIDEGFALLQRATDANALTPGWQEFFFFLDAHLKQDLPRAQLHAMRHGALRFPLGLVARIIVAHDRGDEAHVRKWRERLASDFPAFAVDIPAAFDRWAMAPEIKNRLLADLDAAGGRDMTRAFDR